MYRHGNTWALVLAAGEGSRLRELTRIAEGVAVPKQFCSLRGGPSLLHEALNRAHAIVSVERLCAVVASQHRRWWAEPLSALPAANVIVQSENRGTATGILLPLLHILEHDPDARLLILPSDHYLRDEHTLERCLRRAVEQLSWRPEEILLLGIEPEEADAELGYIMPGESNGRGARHVIQFLEKPSLPLARELIERGALWNAFILAASARALLALYGRHHAELVMELRRAVRRDLHERDVQATTALYEQLPVVDFSRHLLEREPNTLRVLSVPQCGWSDLGTPRRLAHTLRHPAHDTAPVRVASFGTSACLKLAAQHERLSADGC